MGRVTRSIAYNYNICDKYDEWFNKEINNYIVNSRIITKNDSTNYIISSGGNYLEVQFKDKLFTVICDINNTGDSDFLNIAATLLLELEHEVTGSYVSRIKNKFEALWLDMP